MNAEAVIYKKITLDNGDQFMVNTRGDINRIINGIVEKESAIVPDRIFSPYVNSVYVYDDKQKREIAVDPVKFIEYAFIINDTKEYRKLYFKDGDSKNLNISNLYYSDVNDAYYCGTLENKMSTHLKINMEGTFII